MEDLIKSNMVYISIILRDSSPVESLFCVLKQDTLLVQPRKTGNRSDIITKTNDISFMFSFNKLSFSLFILLGFCVCAFCYETSE